MILTVTLNAAIDKRYVVSSYELGMVNRVLECSYTPGGKGLNVSKPAAIYGAKVVATGFVGGHAGNYIEEALEDFGVLGDFYKLAAESRTCINIWDESKRQQTEFLEPGFTVSTQDWQGFLAKFSKLVKMADVVSISGSVPKGLDGTCYQEMIGIVRAEGKPVILDTSGTLLTMGIEATPTMVKPNIDEIRMLTNCECNTQEELLQAAKSIQQKGVEVVVISLGADGSLVVSGEGVYRAIVPKIDAVNTVGCGDSMTAGFAIGFEQGYSIKETLRLASAISAAVALREETGYFVKEDMRELYDKIHIEEL